ncbi:hypothetical protein OTK55_06380 [Methanosphaera sp. Vir-13MRS]|jgi:hypothetical protein|uniref:hypothetical protein n=1 Tax=Candidatus Methanosphaera massiliense TaxID=3017187 RepID=UPI002380BEA6|nr:hypothetical protein [Candidatus Methanosphaera massiliense]MDD6285478.1 hypothetical protein [Methanobacteriaceae archaeon]MDE4078641.1 hypothetical protein [Candidatus Methanosphaera massiliense]MDY2744106.1 hypothetical protein [Methanosphaera sp.]
MMMKCDICGCEFDHTKAGHCDCGFDCCGLMLKCPRCGIHIDLPPELKKEKQEEHDKKSIFTRLEKELEDKL